MNLDVFTVPLDPTNPGQEIFDPVNAWPGASARVYVNTYRFSPLGVFQFGFDPADGRGWLRSLPEPGAAWTPWANSGNPPVPIVIDALDPLSMAIGGADQTLTVNGSGFTSASVINFNGGDEPTVFVSETQLTTVVKPSLVWAPIVLPIYVRNYQRQSNAVNFAFTAATGGTRK